jgi:hypothetical protein
MLVRHGAAPSLKKLEQFPANIFVKASGVLTIRMEGI